ncbi:helix-turn-helix domain-containing protein [Halobacillus sp. SY10]|uniref:helix-turn-helix domain-containing protein n=1 Tax=Halobacillus sp. SY10 TaxID=3381356 RepID=UPI00387972DA
MDVGKRIKKIRDEKGIQQLELAHKVNISQTKMNKIESGYQKKIEPDILIEIANSLMVTTDYLLGRSDTPHLSEEEEFKAFANNPELDRFYRELPQSDEEDLEKLRAMWEIIKKKDKKK